MAMVDLGKALEELLSSEPLPEGEPRLVSGRIVVTEPARSVVGGVTCALAWSVVTDLRTRRSVILPAANDFLLDSAEGRFAVRVAGLVVMVPDTPRPERLPDEVAEKLRAELEAAGLDLWHGMEFTEVTLHAQDEVAVRGIWRREVAPSSEGYRGETQLPTLSADQGRLEVELLVPHRDEHE